MDDILKCPLCGGVKFQDQGNSGKCLYCGASIETVSYTHLDVYKRQGEGDLLAIGGYGSGGCSFAGIQIGDLLLIVTYQVDPYFLRIASRTLCIDLSIVCVAQCLIATCREETYGMCLELSDRRYRLWGVERE